MQLPQVVYVDDPRMFALLGQMFPGARLVQDAFHLLDRFSRAIPANNTLKGGHVHTIGDRFVSSTTICATCELTRDCFHIQNTTTTSPPFVTVIACR